MTKYNGWHNWDTWNAHLWLSSDECLYHQAVEVVRNNDAKALENLVISIKENDGILVSRVNWKELADAFRE